MNLPEIITKQELSGKKELRGLIYSIENAIKEMDNPDIKTFFGDTEICPLKHSFAPGIYVREIKIPAGMVIVGKLHKHEHPNFLLEGEVIVITEDGGREYLKAPCSMISKGGTKRALYSVTDLVWTTVHHNPTDTQDLDELEEIIIAKDYLEYAKYVNADKIEGRKIRSLIIK